MKNLSTAAVLLAFSLFFLGCVRINPGYVGIRVNLTGEHRGVEDYPTVNGWILYFPLTQSIYEYPTFMQTAIWTASPHEGRPIDESITFNDRDQVTISADINLSYSLDATKVPAFYVQFRSDKIDDFTHGYLRNVARDAFNSLASRYSFDEINGAKKDDFLTKVAEKINQDVGRFGVQIHQFGFVGALRPPHNIAESINMKIQAVQRAIQAENELREARAQAAKMVARAEGEARSNELLTKSITPTLIEWRRLEITARAIERWDGRRPTVEGSGSGLLLNLGSEKR
ncbi:MAG: hypothetical protein C5B49_02245 [Bdellovibrio sp.]|nr:MAG: hypothetical protein C5B49_02245 [Bdellovibrio sp.]